MLLLGTSQTRLAESPLPSEDVSRSVGGRRRAPALGRDPGAVSRFAGREWPGRVPLAHVPVHLKDKFPAAGVLGQRGHAFAIF